MDHRAVSLRKVAGNQPPIKPHRRTIHRRFTSAQSRHISKQVTERQAMASERATSAFEYPVASGSMGYVPREDLILAVDSIAGHSVIELNASHPRWLKPSLISMAP